MTGAPLRCGVGGQMNAVTVVIQNDEELIRRAAVVELMVRSDIESDPGARQCAARSANSATRAASSSGCS